MKQFTKTTLSVIVILSLSLFFVQCDSAKKKFIEQQVEEVNKQCPMNLGNGIVMEKCSAEGNETLKIEISVADPSSVVIDDNVKTAMLQGIKATPEFKLVKQFGITYLYAFTDSDKNLLGEIKITPEDYN